MTHVLSLQLLVLLYIGTTFARAQGYQRVRYFYFKGAPGERGRDGQRGPPGTDGRAVSNNNNNNSNNNNNNNNNNNITTTTKYTSCKLFVIFLKIRFSH